MITLTGISLEKQSHILNYCSCRIFFTANKKVALSYNVSLLYRFPFDRFKWCGALSIGCQSRWKSRHICSPQTLVARKPSHELHPDLVACIFNHFSLVFKRIFFFSSTLTISSTVKHEVHSVRPDLGNPRRSYC